MCDFSFLFEIRIFHAELFEIRISLAELESYCVIFFLLLCDIFCLRSEFFVLNCLRSEFLLLNFNHIVSLFA
jgi:hypothetical protein